MNDSRFAQVIEAARKGGAVVKAYFGSELEAKEKSHTSDVITRADLESEEAVLQALASAFPEANVLSEEEGFIDRHSQYTFVVDPLDGSNNFILGIPNFSVSIGLLKEDKVVFGVVHAPMLDRTYLASKDKGAFLNDKRISVNRNSDARRASLSSTQ